MSIKDEFTSEEWMTLLQAPMVAGISIISSDVGITSVPKETAAMVRAMIENPIPAGADELVGAMVDDLKAMSDNRDEMKQVQPEISGESPAAIRQQVNAQLQAASALVGSRVSADTATAYKEWVYSVAQSVAEAGKEGGFLGIGAVRVSEQEKAALAALRADLDLPSA